MKTSYNENKNTKNTSKLNVIIIMKSGNIVLLRNEKLFTTRLFYLPFPVQWVDIIILRKINSKIFESNAYGF
jgi:hypothetical protein